MRDINEWPYDGVDGMEANFNANNGLWVETTEDTYYDQLGCVPPKCMKDNAFMVGECYTGNSYAAFVEVNGRFFGKICSVITFRPDWFTKEIKEQFGL